MDYVDWGSNEHCDVKKKHRFDLLLFPLTKKRFLCRNDCSMFAITKNQWGVSLDVASLEAFWGVEWEPSGRRDNHRLQNRTTLPMSRHRCGGKELTNHTTVVTGEPNKFGSLEALLPPVKKIRRDGNVFKKAWTAKPNHPIALTNKRQNKRQNKRSHFKNRVFESLWRLSRMTKL